MKQTSLCGAILGLLAVVLPLSQEVSALVVPTPAIAWDAYKNLLKAHPLVTKSATAAVLAGVSDAITQRVEPLNEGELRKHDFVRTAHIVMTGFVWSGPSAHYWYQSLERIVQRLNFAIQGNPVKALFTRSILDAILFSPSTVAGYLTVRTILEGKGWKGVVDKLRVAWAKIVLSAWKFWPAVNVFSFWFLPVEYRVLYANIMSLLWTGYLSFMNQLKAKQLQQEQATSNP